MSSKLTLSINESVVRRAKQYARAHGKSLSKVIEQYLSYVTQDELPPTEVTDEVARLSDTRPASLVERDLKYEYLDEKYLRDFVRVLPMTEAQIDSAVQRPGDDFLTEGVQALEPDEFMKIELSEKRS